MAKNSKIEWTHHTFNPWWGCTKISPACDNCYAEAWAIRVGKKVWGAKAPRRFFSEAHWKEPLKWNAEASKEKQRRRVFCASMADVFENRKELNAWREKLWGLIEATPFLDWLLLTKRPSLIAHYSPWKKSWPENVWLGTTVESQEWAEERIPHLIKHPAKVKFLSCEPLLGKLDISKWLHTIDWVIAGGESGSRAKARPMNPTWVRSLRDQCLKATVSFHFKQWGHWSPTVNHDQKKVVSFFDSTGAIYNMSSLGKKASGRKLDGKTWNQLPT